MSLAIFGLFKALSPLFLTTPRRFAPAGSIGLARPAFQAPISLAPAHQSALVTRPVDTRPLRVTRLLDQGCARSCAGRMVMSGRFDDVCAELDRLVELESAREATRMRH